MNPDGGADAPSDRAIVDGPADSGSDQQEASVDGPPGDAGTDAGARTVAGLLAKKSPACLSCAQASCPDEMNGCTNVMGNAAAGPAMGVSRQTLCLDTVECVETSSPNCGAALLGNCYCGTAAGTACLSSGNAGPNGVCKATIERGLETTDPPTIATKFTETTLGSGAAMFLFQCLADNDCRACFDGADGGGRRSPRQIFGP
jgi:hypothetical protein